MQRLIDRFGRLHDYLRISVTDQCNLRCVYCMPEEGMTFDPPENIMQAWEIHEVVRVAASMGVSKLRITGGEPTVRRDLPDVVERLSSIPGIEDIALTTNGLSLQRQAADLRKAGVTRVNVSLDSMRPERYEQITRGGQVRKVLQGLEACFAEGLSPVKLNVVLMKGINEDEIDDFIRLAHEHPLQVRFIEYMPIGHEGEEWRKKYISLDHALARCRRLGLSPERTEGSFGNGPAENWTWPGAKGSIGFIHPVSDHFCQTCNRLRLTADGNVKPCLYWEKELNVRPYAGDDEAVAAVLREAMAIKPQNHEMAQTLENQPLSHRPTSRRMSQIGG